MPDDLDDLSGIPRYLQVARVIEAEIRAGQWTPGNAVPSRNQLAERFGIARETAARAHAWLARAGYLVAVPGVGMVVTPASRWPEEAILRTLQQTAVLSADIGSSPASTWSSSWASCPYTRAGAEITDTICSPRQEASTLRRLEF